MIEVLVEEDRQARMAAGPRKSIPQNRGDIGEIVPDGHDFVRLAMAETGCSEAAEADAAGRARALAARAFARAERERVGGLRLLDAELERLCASSPAAASVIAAVGRDLAAISGGAVGRGGDAWVRAGEGNDLGDCGGDGGRSRHPTD